MGRVTFILTLFLFVKTEDKKAQREYCTTKSFSHILRDAVIFNLTVSC